MRIVTFAKPLQNHIGLFRSFQWIDQWIFSAREIILLDINNKKSCFHTAKYSRSLTKTDSTTPDVAHVAITTGVVESLFPSISKATSHLAESVVLCVLRHFSLQAPS